jgi:hypothetical protein
MGDQQAEQARYLDRTIRQLVDHEAVSGIFVYELLDELMGEHDPEAHYGLCARKRDAEGRWSLAVKKPAFLTYQSIIAESAR